MRRVGESEPPAGNRNATNVRDHPERINLLLKIGRVGWQLTSAGEMERTGAEIREEIETAWNTREKWKGIQRRILPMIYGKTKPSLSGPKNVSGENEWLLRNWYVQKFTIAGRRNKVPSITSR